MNKTILLADDEDSVRHTLSKVLEAEHYDVMTAHTGDEAVAQFIQHGPPDLVLLDLNMPEKDGWEAFDLMNRQQPMVPVIVITARPHQYRKAAELGIDALMEKPLDLTTLLHEIHALLAESDQARWRRLTNPNFKTEFLAHHASEPVPGGLL